VWFNHLHQTGNDSPIKGLVETRGWGDEAARHRKLVERLDTLMNRTAS